ncbi:hypothetical protein [Robinsoniella sp. KNHs210]|uniref:hypothetical protein n=1 Tax=Robinsoniella sp. KNHs210 TaxID=1469950 RepID=UPI0012DE9D5E|nr:hypothetical protein [Robinsoniella sp. KNHs210]
MQQGLELCPKAEKAMAYFKEVKTISASGKLGEQEYVMELIPSTGNAEGRNAARMNHKLT